METSETLLSYIDSTTAIPMVQQWNSIRQHSNHVNDILQAGHYFTISLDGLPESLIGEGHVHAYLGLEGDPATSTFTTADLRLLLISEEQDAMVAGDPTHVAPMWKAHYESFIASSESGVNWDNLLMHWDQHYTTWVQAINTLSASKMTTAFRFMKQDLVPPAGETVIYAHFGLRNTGVLYNDIDLLFYTANSGNFEGIVPADFTTPVPPFPNGSNGWGVSAI